MNKFIVGVLIVFSMSIGFFSCESLGLSDTVITTQDQVIPGAEYEILPSDQIPEALQAAVPKGAVMVVTGKESLLPDASFVSLGPSSDEGNIEGWIKMILGLGSAFIPGLAAWEGVLTLFSKRKQRHYGRALKKASPFSDGSMNVPGAMSSVLSALGSSHSSSNSRAAFESEAT